MYLSDAQLEARVRIQEWDREVEAMRLSRAAIGMPQERAAGGYAMGKLLVDLFTAARAAISGRRERTA